MNDQHTQILTIARLYTDEDGRTRFEDVFLEGAVKKSAVSALRGIHTGLFDVETLQFRRVTEEDESGNLHNAPARQLSVQLSGVSEFIAGDGTSRRIGPGEMILLEDTTGEGHTSRNAGDVPRVSMHIRLADTARIAG